MKVQITRSILIGGVPQMPGTILETTARNASDWIARGCAELAPTLPEPQVETPEVKPKRSKKSDAA
jgi:hypothetical protein